MLSYEYEYSASDRCTTRCALSVASVERTREASGSVRGSVGRVRCLDVVSGGGRGIAREHLTVLEGQHADEERHRQLHAGEDPVGVLHFAEELRALLRRRARRLPAARRRARARVDQTAVTAHVAQERHCHQRRQQCAHSVAEIHELRAHRVRIRGISPAFGQRTGQKQRQAGLREREIPFQRTTQRARLINEIFHPL